MKWVPVESFQVKSINTYLVGVPISGVDSTMLVVKLHGAGDGLGQGEAGSHGLGPVELLPDWLGDILGHQGMLGLDLREGVRHDAISNTVLRKTEN